MTTADFRASGGCTDLNNNSTDFMTATVAPRNSASITNPCPAPLAVSFISFDAQYQAATNDVLLTWRTAQELNAKEFVVARSTDGKAWTAIAQQAAAGYSSAITQYQATDADPQPGTNLYRVSQRDMEGHMQYTGTVTVNAAGRGAGFNVYPNPTTGIVHISTTLQADAGARICITDVSGRVVLQQQAQLDAGQALNLDLSRLDKGTYFITLSSGAFVKTEKIALN